VLPREESSVPVNQGTIGWGRRISESAAHTDLEQQTPRMSKLRTTMKRLPAKKSLIMVVRHVEYPRNRLGLVRDAEECCTDLTRKALPEVKRWCRRSGLSFT
jgi:hypothetical protein